MDDWVELTKVNGEIDAQLVAGSLENEGIPTRLQKTAGAWRYGASDAFVLIAIYVPQDRLDDAAGLLEHPSGEVSSFDTDDAAHDATADPFARSSTVRWWVAAVVLVGLVVAFLQADVLELIR